MLLFNRQVWVTATQTLWYVHKKASTGMSDRGFANLKVVQGVKPDPRYTIFGTRR